MINECLTSTSGACSANVSQFLG